LLVQSKGWIGVSKWVKNGKIRGVNPP
jgi:hypothetical protein